MIYSKYLLQGIVQLIDVSRSQSEVFLNQIDPVSVSKEHADMNCKTIWQW